MSIALLRIIHEFPSRVSSRTCRESTGFNRASTFRVQLDASCTSVNCSARCVIPISHSRPTKLVSVRHSRCTSVKILNYPRLSCSFAGSLCRASGSPLRDDTAGEVRIEGSSSVSAREVPFLFTLFCFIRPGKRRLYSPACSGGVPSIGNLAVALCHSGPLCASDDNRCVAPCCCT